MEPKLPAPAIERMPSPVNYSQSGEVLPLPPTPETGLEQRQEQHEQGSVNQAATTQNPVNLPVLPTPVALPVDDLSTATVPVDDTPLVANDDDLIEKEWVDKAKKIITETRDDPHRREQEVSKLQADYLLKRYGKELGASQ
ncbi:MAG: hypothetical protein ABIQ04_05270 [Candidatus Saccharimonadales bacterium]